MPLGPRILRFALALGAVLFAAWLPRPAGAIPAFARRYETSCKTCHEFHYPQLNAFGRLFKENGYQLPAGAEDAIRARRTIEPGTVEELLAVAKEPPLGLRGQVYGLVPLYGTAKDRPAYEDRLFTYLYGGGAIAPDISFFFSLTPYPTLVLHQAHVGFHNLASSWLGEGTLNLRAGALFLLDSTRPAHRLLDPGASAFGNVLVGLNRFALDSTTLGVEAFGHPGRGAFGYELAVVAGDPGDTTTAGDRDGWKDVFLRLSYTLFHETSHEVIVGAFGYRGRSEIQAKLAGVDLALADDVWFLGGDLEAAIGPLTVFAAGYASRHRSAQPQVGAIVFGALRGELSWAILDELTLTARHDRVWSSDLPSLDARPLSINLTYLVASNVALSATWRHDFDVASKKAAIGLVDVAF